MINWANTSANPIKDLENADKRQFLCEWKLSPRDKALRERLAQYYREADINPKAWQQCFIVLRTMGYTVAEINAAKRNHRHDNN